MYPPQHYQFGYIIYCTAEIVDNNGLVPLRFPIGWTIEWNIFTQVSPEDFIDEEHEHRWEYNEDLFKFVHYRQKRILDLG